MPPTRYNLIAGTSVERLAALSDGVFAVALTLLVLDLKVPAPDTADLGAALIALAPKFLTWIVSFLTLGIFWVGQQTQLNHLAKAGRSLDWTIPRRSCVRSSRGRRDYRRNRRSGHIGDRDFSDVGRALRGRGIPVGRCRDRTVDPRNYPCVRLFASSRRHVANPR